MTSTLRAVAALVLLVAAAVPAHAQPRLGIVVESGASHVWDQPDAMSQGATGTLAAGADVVVRRFVVGAGVRAQFGAKDQVALAPSLGLLLGPVARGRTVAYVRAGVDVGVAEPGAAPWIGLGGGGRRVGVELGYRRDLGDTWSHELFVTLRLSVWGR